MKPAVGFLSFMLFFSSFSLLSAQTLERSRPERGLSCENALPEETFQALCRLSAARKAGDIPRVRELEMTLFGEEQSATADDAPPSFPIDAHDRSTVASPLWGDDVKVYTGAIYSGVGTLGGGTRQIRVCYDTVGGIYLGMNRVYLDSVSLVSIYKSTNGGRNWSSVGGVYNPSYPIQSFDMCVTDTADGGWLISVVYVLKSDKSLDGGGALRWYSVHDNGSKYRISTISATSSGTAFRNPSICTDGATYLPQSTYHYVAAEYYTSSTDVARGIHIVQTTNWGMSWGTPDTSLHAGNEGTPVIAVDCGSNPDSIVVAYSRGVQPLREIRIARSAKLASFSWAVTVPSPQPGDNFDPSLAIDATRGNAMITYTRFEGAPHYQDVRSFRSSNLFTTYSHDSIAATSEYEGLSSVSYAPWTSGYYWRVAYRSTYNDGTIYYKSLQNKLSSWYSVSPIAINQFKPEYSLAPVMGTDRDSSGGSYRGNIAYVGDGPTDVYFDAVDLTVDAPEEALVPATYSLLQNYPNPFNPITNVKFSIVNSGDVKLVVYDIQGREVRTLVNESLKPGTYEAAFDGSALNTGVYFYKLITNTFSETKKMLLIK